MLALRLHEVRRMLTPAARDGHRQTELVHRLRVATRRAAATLEVTRDLVPQKKRRKVSRRLRQVRRAAGEARDLDVLIKRWKADSARKAPLEALKLLDSLGRRRRDAQKPLAKTDTRRWHRKMSKAIARLTRGLASADRAGRSETLHHHAVRNLRGLVKEFLNSEIDLADTASLHELRIRAKLLRYSMECFAGAFDAAFRERLYPQIEALQDALGSVNDHAVAVERLGFLSSRSRHKRHADFGRLIDLEIADLDRAKRRFAKQWTPAKRQSLRREFAAYLGERAV